MGQGDEHFIEEYRPFVRSIAHKLRAELDLTTDLDDLIADGFRGLVEARGRFDPDRGVQFSTFAYYRVRGAMLDGVRKMGFLPRRAHGLVRAAEATDFLAEEAGEARALSHRAKAAHSGAALTALDDALARITAAFALSAVGQGGEEPVTPEAQVASEREGAGLRREVLGLPDRERALVMGFYFEGRRFDEVAAELGISKSWASRLHKKALDLLRERLEETAGGGER